MSKEKFFERALEACTRKTASGKTEDCFEAIASFWQHYTKSMPLPFIQPKDVCMMMVLLKVARVLNGYKIEDSLADIAGYVACANELYEEEKERKESSPYA